MELPKILFDRPADTDKRHYGHALLVAGSYGKMGCAVLAARACMRAGAGLLTVHVPRRGVEIIQAAFPEAMLSIDANDNIFTSIPEQLSHYDALAVGPGIGTNPMTALALLDLVQTWQQVNPDRPILFDADALNILAKCDAPRYEHLPSNSILTPHAREYARLFGETSPAKISQDHKVILVKKAHRTQIYSPNGDLCINDTGNPGMATAGSGDVLTGLILGLLAQGLSPFEAARLGVYLHGAAGDRAAEGRGQAAVIASDIIENLCFLDFSGKL